MQLNASNQYLITFASQGSCTNAYMDKNCCALFSQFTANAIKYSPQGGNVNFALACEQGEASAFAIRALAPQKINNRCLNPSIREKCQ